MFILLITFFEDVIIFGTITLAKLLQTCVIRVFCNLLVMLTGALQKPTLNPANPRLLLKLFITINLL